MHDDMNDPIFDIAAILREPRNARRLVLGRDGDERAFLREFVSLPSQAGADPPGAEERRGRIEERVCRKCGNVRDYKGPVGAGENGVMIILNPPSMVSGLERRKYRDEAAALMKKMMEAIGVDIRKCRITSLIKCEPSDPSLSPGGMFANCEAVLDSEIASVAPRVAIVMGDMRPLKRLRDRHADVAWFALDHPIALINNPDLKRGAWNTLKLAREAIG